MHLRLTRPSLKPPTPATPTSPSTSTPTSITPSTTTSTTTSTPTKGSREAAAILAGTIVATVAQGLEPPTGATLSRILGKERLSAPQASSSLLSSTAMGRAAEVAIRTGVLTVPSSSPVQAQAVVDDVVVPGLQALHDVDAATLLSSNATSALVLGGLSKTQRGLFLEVLGGADLRTTAGILAEVRTAVATGRPAAVNAAIAGVIATRVSPAQVLALDVVDGLSARHLQVLHALKDLDGNHNVTVLRSSVFSLVLSPSYGALPLAERDAALAAVLQDRRSYDAGTRGHEALASALAEARAAEVKAGVCTPERGQASFWVGPGEVAGVGCAVALHFKGESGDDVVPVTTPTVVPPGTPTADELGVALGRIDPGVRRLVREIVINPVESPHDAVARQTPGFSPTHRSAATASAGPDVIRFYPGALESMGEDRSMLLTGLLTHELAHLLQARVARVPALQKAWVDAVAADDVRASNYAFSTDGEDFAEAFALHQTSKGTRFHDALRALMPHRFGAMDEIMQALPTLTSTPTPTPTPSM